MSGGIAKSLLSCVNLISVLLLLLLFSFCVISAVSVGSGGCKGVGQWGFFGGKQLWAPWSGGGGN